MNEIKIRNAKESDAEILSEIYAYYVLNTAITFECAAPDSNEFARRMRAVQRKYPYLVCELDGKIAGYAYAAHFNERDAYSHSAEVTIYIAKDFRRSGIGRKLYQALEEILCRMNVKNLYACIAHPDTDDEYLNRDSEHFHEHMGYKICGTFRDCGYKFSRWYSMVWAEKQIAAHEPNPAPFIPITRVPEQI